MRFLKKNKKSYLIEINEELTKYKVNKNEQIFKNYTERCYNYFKNGGKTEIWDGYQKSISIQNNLEVIDMDFKSINHNPDSIYVHLGLGMGLGNGQGKSDMESVLYNIHSNEIDNNLVVKDNIPKIELLQNGNLSDIIKNRYSTIGPSIVHKYIQDLKYNIYEQNETLDFNFSFKNQKMFGVIYDLLFTRYILDYILLKLKPTEYQKISKIRGLYVSTYI